MTHEEIEKEVSRLYYSESNEGERYPVLQEDTLNNGLKIIRRLNGSTYLEHNGTTIYLGTLSDFIEELESLEPVSSYDSVSDYEQCMKEDSLTYLK